MTENIGRQPPTDCVNTLPGQLQLNDSNAEHFRPRDFQKVKEGAEKETRRFQMNHWEHKKSEHLVLHQLCHTEQKVSQYSWKKTFLFNHSLLNSPLNIRNA